MQKCSELGIKGRNIPRELAQLQQQLPGLFQDALADINSPAIASAMDHYAAVTAYAHSPAPDAAAPDPSQTPPTDLKQLLPHLQAIRSNNHLQQLGTNPSDTANRTEDEAVSVQGDSQEIQWDVTGDESPRSQESADAANAGGAAIDWDVTIDPGADTTGTTHCMGLVHFTVQVLGYATDGNLIFNLIFNLGMISSCIIL